MLLRVMMKAFYFMFYGRHQISSDLHRLRTKVTDFARNLPKFFLHMTVMRPLCNHVPQIFYHSSKLCMNTST